MTVWVRRRLIREPYSTMMWVMDDVGGMIGLRGDGASTRVTEPGDIDDLAEDLTISSDWEVQA